MNQERQRNRWLGGAHRAGWGLADQSLSSLTNLALGVAVARAVSPGEFGVFALALTAYWLALGTSRAIATEPYVIRYTDAAADARRNAMSAAAGTALAAGVFAGVVLVLIGSLAGRGVTTPVLAMGIVMPCLLLQDFWRFAFFVEGQGSAALMNDLCWAVGFALFLAMLAGQSAGAGWYILAWGGAAAIAALYGARQLRTIPNARASARWLREQSDLAPRYLAEFWTTLGAGQLSFYIVGAVAGVASVGAMRAGQILLGPLHVLFMGLGLTAVAEGVRLLKISPRELHHGAKMLSALLAGAATVWGSLLLLLPDDVGTALLGQSWPGGREVVLYLALAMAGSGAMAGAFAGMRALAAASLSLRVRLIGAPLIILAVGVGAIVNGAVGAAVGLAIAQWCTAAVAWWHFGEAAKRVPLETHATAPRAHVGDAKPAQPTA